MPRTKCPRFGPNPWGLNPSLCDRTNQRYGRLVAIEYAGRRPGKNNNRANWLCRCDCGKEILVASDCLVSGKVRSCGCFELDRRVKMTERLTTHGRSRTPEYAIWRAIKCRCLLPSYPNFSDYGGRGITICKQWADSFETFLADVGARPTRNMTIERLDNRKGYEPGNVEWATRLANNDNRSCSISITFRGETRPLHEWAKLLGMPYNTLFCRIQIYHWPIERALTEAIRNRTR